MTVGAPSREPLTADQRNAFLASFLGWTMDAYDYFIVVLVYADIAKDFHVSLTKMAFVTTATLLMRPVGAVIFGMWADRKGRRLPLLVDVSFYSMVGFACAFAPSYVWLLALRLLYGIGMGGEWGSARPWRWRRSPWPGGASSPDCCSRATPWGTCWQR